MSRHRNIRNLDEDDYYDDDYYDDDEYYDEDEYYLEQQREQERKKKEEAERKAKENKLKQQKLQQQKLQQQKLKQQQLDDAKKKTTGGKGGGGISVASAAPQSGGNGISLGKSPPGFTVESKKNDTATKNNNAQNMPIPQLPPNILASLRSNSTTGEVIRSHLSLVILGHVDAGKSTLTGRLLLSLNHVSQRLLQKYQKAATSIGKSSFALAWFTDEDDSERERGVTIDIGTKFAKTEKFDFTILDAPGHKDFIPNMISGTASADCGLLVVAATTGEFEAGFARGGDASYSGGQTREHIVLSRGLGVTQFVVAVNKLDAAEPAWCQERFEHIKSMVLDFLKQNGFKEARITFIPVSGLTGVNISNSDKVEDEDGWKALKKWYKGPTLLEALDGFSPAKRGYEKPLRAIVTDVSSEGKHVNVRGRVVQGFIQSGDNVVVLPVGDDANVVRVERGKAAQEGSSTYSFASPSPTTSSSTSNEAQLDGIALAGDTVELTLANIDSARLMTGCVICHPQPSLRPKVEQRFEARISIMERLAVPIIRGSSVLLHMHSIDVPAVLNKLISSEKRGDGKPRQNPRVLTGGVTATVEITLSERLVIEESNECKALGRFVLRRGGDTIAVGLIDKVLS
mmetsp:Transcript_32543/g.55485  ORF Transcript_32543/g.55485 Transcript_32543/m.55485 type:complete len:628 (+) Transcript_32543:168-2051(+)